MSKDRDFTIDFIKCIAAIMVVTLHVNGYAAQTFDNRSQLNYIIFELLALPAIHLFVMTTCRLSMKGMKMTVRRLLYLWVELFFVSLLGLIIVIVFFPQDLSFDGLLRCFFPIIGGSYWYITAHFAFVFIIPILRNSLEVVEKYITINLVYFLIVVSVLPTFAKKFDWTIDLNQLMLFVLIFYMTYWLLKNKRKVAFYIASYGLGFSVLFASILILKSTNYDCFYFMKYNSPFTLLMAVGLYGIIDNLKIKKNGKMIERISKASMFIYLIHMHPIIKGLYKKYSVLLWMHEDSALLFSFEKCMLVVGIVIIGTILYAILEKLFIKITNILYKIIEGKMTNKIDEWLSI